MSRSFKKNPISILCCEKNNKIIFNRRLRHNNKLSEDVINCNYKKLNQSYDIVDWKCFEDISKATLFKEGFKTKKERKAYIKRILSK